MKVAFMLNARDKAKHVRDAVRSMLTQEGPPLEILLSDQGSVDGTREILDEEASKYDGPHKVVRLNCPPEVCRAGGMPGLNEHINWVMSQTDADVVLQISADDLALPTRALKVRRAFEEHQPSMVLTGMYYVDEGLRYLAESAWPEQDGWCKVEEMHARLVGGSASQAWTHEFFDKIGGLKGVGSQDVVMPFLATLDKGAWYIHERLHVYRCCVDPQNTGLEGVYKAIPEADRAGRIQIEELMHFQVLSGMRRSLEVMDALGWRTDAALMALAQAMLDRAMGWSRVREAMSFERVSPVPFKCWAER